MLQKPGNYRAFQGILGQARDMKTPRWGNAIKNIAMMSVLYRLVAMFWEQGIGGSNPLVPTNDFKGGWEISKPPYYFKLNNYRNV